MSKDSIRVPLCILYACCGSKCKKKGGKQMYKAMKARVKSGSLKRMVQVIKTGCTDRCKMGPIVSVMPANTWYTEVSEDKIEKIFETHLVDLLKCE